MAEEFITKSGKVLTEDEIWALADDAEHNPVIRAQVQTAMDGLVENGLVRLGEGGSYEMTEKGQDAARSRGRTPAETERLSHRKLIPQKVHRPPDAAEIWYRARCRCGWQSEDLRERAFQCDIDYRHHRGLPT